MSETWTPPPAGGAFASPSPHSVPPLPRLHVVRRRLGERLDHATTGALTVLVAPAGAGKTLGVVGWLHARPEVTDPTVWITADDAWRPHRLEALLDESATGRPGQPPGLVVVDDAERLPGTTVRFLDERLASRPESMRVLLVSRRELPVTSLIAELHGHLTVLRGDVLRLDRDEVGRLVALHAHSEDEAIVEAVDTAAGGWAAAAVLVARTVAAAQDPLKVARRAAEGEIGPADRVASEAFAALHPRERHLLLCSVGAPHFTVDQIALLTGNGQAEEVVSGLHRTGLLVTRRAATAPGRDEDAEAVYRVHPIMARLVRRHLALGGVDAAQARGTVVRAARAEWDRGDTRPAFEHLVAVGAAGTAGELLVDDGVRLVLSGLGPMIATFGWRHPDVVDAMPGTWFTLALERWIVDDVGAAGRWLDRIVDAGEDSCGVDVVACARLMRGRLGLEELPPAVEHAERTAHALARQRRPGSGQSVLPLLYAELGICQNWLGPLSRAEINLTAALGLCRSLDLTALAVKVTTHLAFTQWMSGQERACGRLAREAMAQIESESLEHLRFAPQRAELAETLSLLVDLPRPRAGAEPPAAVLTHAADLCTRFWARIRDSRLALLSGSLVAAERILASPLDLPGPLAPHLQAAWAVERAAVASMAADPGILAQVKAELRSCGAEAEAAVAAGLRADLAGERRPALEAFEKAGSLPTRGQPDTRALALACQAQLLDALGEPEEALGRLQEAMRITEVRGDAAPFLGWSRAGTPMPALLAQLQRAHGEHFSGWPRELAEAARDRPGLERLASRVRGSASGADERPWQPELSPREHDVLVELARGATYADIAANLYLSENTVKTHVSRKTHVSSLSRKLGASRRSEALAVARRRHLV